MGEDVQGSDPSGTSNPFWVVIEMVLCSQLFYR